MVPAADARRQQHHALFGRRFQRNAVSNTYTLNFPYGVGLVAEGTGVLLNNELDDFTAAPGASNAFGLVGFEANLPGPGKRPLSSMSPTIVLKDGKPVLVTGSPGGSRIISAVMQVIVNVIDYKMDIAAAVAAPRGHHQWLPDDVRFERGFPDEVLAELKAKDHKVIDQLGQTSANSIAVTPHGLQGAPDPRTRGAERRGSEAVTAGNDWPIDYSQQPKLSPGASPMASLKGKTLFISGASRGIGLAIALRAARDGANIAIAAKTAEPHPKLKGTIYTAADEFAPPAARRCRYSATSGTRRR